MAVRIDKLERKRILDFYMICKTFQENGVRTEEDAGKAKDNLLKNCKIQVGVVSVISIIMALIFSKYVMTVVLFATIFLIYICVFTYRGRNYVDRYIKEVLNHPDYDPVKGFPDPLAPKEPTSEESEESEERVITANTEQTKQ
jgi:hypothetical protein